MSIEETKKGRGKPPGSLKENAMRATLKLRLSNEDLAKAHRAADLLGEDISEFVRVAIRQRCKKTSKLTTTGGGRIVPLWGEGRGDVVTSPPPSMLKFHKRSFYAS